MSKGQAKQSRESHNPRFALSRAKFRTVGFSRSIEINAASSDKLLCTSIDI